MKPSYSEAELRRIALEHREHFKSVNAWNEYRKEKGLPSASTFINVFGSWNTFKEMLGFTVNNQYRPQLYSDDELLTVLDKYKEHYTSPSKWNAYAQEHSLPTHGVFKQRFGDEVIMERTGSLWRKRDGEETVDYAAIMREHYPDKAPTAREWTEYARKHKLPTSIVYIRHYGSWNKAKRQIY